MFRRSLLEQIEDTLQQAGFAALMRDATDDDPIKGVFVDLGDDAGGSYTLKLSLASTAHEVMQAREPELHTERNAYKEFDYLQYYVALPWQVPAERREETGRLLLRLNAEMPLLGYGLDADEGRVYFRHMRVIESGQVDGRVVARIVQLISFLLREYRSTIEAVAAESQHNT